MDEDSLLALVVIACIFVIFSIAVLLAVLKVLQSRESVNRSLPNTKEAEAIRKSRSELAVILEPMQLAISLYSKGIIDRDTNNRILYSSNEGQQREMMLSAVEAKCQSDPQAFRVFVDILSEEPCWKAAVDALMKNIRCPDEPASNEPSNSETQGCGSEVLEVFDISREPSLQVVSYSGPCVTRRFHKLQSKYIMKVLQNDVEWVNKQTEKLVKSGAALDFKVLALEYQAFCRMHNENKLNEAKQLFQAALEYTKLPDCKNGDLLQARLLRSRSSLYLMENQFDKARDCICEAHKIMFVANPTFITACIRCNEVKLKLKFIKDEPMDSPRMGEIEESLKILLKLTKYFEEYEKPAVCPFVTMKASFHLRSSTFTDVLPPPLCWPSTQDIQNAEECLKGMSLADLPNEVNYYAADYYRCLSDLHLWKKEYATAIEYAKTAKRIYCEGKIRNNSSALPEQRLKLLKRLQKEKHQQSCFDAIFDENH